MCRGGRDSLCGCHCREIGLLARSRGSRRAPRAPRSGCRESKFTGSALWGEVASPPCTHEKSRRLAPSPPPAHKRRSAGAHARHQCASSRRTCARSDSGNRSRTRTQSAHRKARQVPIRLAHPAKAQHRPVRHDVPGQFDFSCQLIAVLELRVRDTAQRHILLREERNIALSENGI